jgi:thymidine kinase
MTAEHDCNLDIIFYLRTNPETCYNRLQQRGRPEETQTVSLDYLQKIHAFHETWLNPSIETSSIKYYKPSSVIIIDGDQSIDDVYKIIEIETRNAVTLAN